VLPCFFDARCTNAVQQVLEVDQTHRIFILACRQQQKSDCKWKK